MAVLKPVRLLYQSKNNTTGLTDVKAQIYLNAVAKAVGASAITLTELDATNAPGAYELLISAATLSSFGVVAGQLNALEGTITSATVPAPAAFRYEVTVANLDDIDTKLGTPAGASVSADIASIKSDSSAIKSDLETGSNSLANILTAVRAIQNNAGFSIPVPAQLARPASGSNTYRIPVNIYNDINSLIDADSNSITVNLVNAAGVDRSTYLIGNAAGSAPAVRDSIGNYHIDVVIPSSAVDEELLLKFSYSIGGAATSRLSTTVIVDAVNIAGLALQSTLLSVQNDTQNIKSDVESPSFGLSVIKADTAAAKSDLESGSFGLAVIKADTANIRTVVNDPSSGNAALGSALLAIEGSGFVTASDSLHSLSVYIRQNVYAGGRAI
jgi:hypothetical protein